MTVSRQTRAGMDAPTADQQQSALALGPAPTPPASREAWYARAEYLAQWILDRLFVRFDRYGGYEAKGNGGKKQFTFPKKGPRVGCVDLKRVLRHCRATGTADIVGAHTLGLDDAGKWCAIDIDCHEGDDADPQANQRFALAIFAELVRLGFKPLLYTSNGRGGFHLLVLFRQAVCGVALFRFARWLVRDHAAQGFKKAPETFPKQATIGGKYGNWLRCVGRHPSWGHWPEVWDGSNWLEGQAAVEYVLSLAGDDEGRIPGDALVDPTPPTSPVASGVTAGPRPEDDPADDVFYLFNHASTQQTVGAMLERAGWTAAGRRGDRFDYRRPGKKAGEGQSGNIRVMDGVPLFYPFTNGTPLEQNKALNPSQLRAQLEFADSFPRLAEQLRHEGFGRPLPARSAARPTSIQVGVNGTHKPAEVNGTYPAPSITGKTDGTLDPTANLGQSENGGDPTRAATGEAPIGGKPPPAQYCVKDGAIHRRVVTKETSYETPLCNFTARIVAETTCDNGVERTKCLTIEGQLADGDALPEVDVRADRFAGMEWVVAEWGTTPVVFAGTGTKDHLRAAVQLLSGRPCQRTVFEHTGWRELVGGWAYLHAGGAIGTHGPVADVEVGLKDKLTNLILPEPPTGAELVRAVRSSLGLADGRLVPDHVGIPLLAVAYRAPLGNADFSVFLFGQTGQRKSELAALIQQHFGAGMDARTLPANWLSTANSIEQAAFAVKDAILVIDDFNPAGTADPQKLHASADRVFRSVGNSAGRERLNSDLTSRAARPPRGIPLATGEDVPRGQSCRARVGFLEVGIDAVNLARLSECQQAARDGFYVRSMSGFVRWLAPQYAAVRERLNIERAAERTKFLAGAPHTRLAGIAGDLFLGLVYFTRFATQIGAMTPKEATAFLERGRVAFEPLAHDSGGHVRAEDPVGRFLRLVRAVVQSGQGHLSGPGGQEPPTPNVYGWQQQASSGRGSSVVWCAQGRRIGWVSGEIVYLDPETAYAEAQRLATSQRNPIGMSERTLWRGLFEQKLLIKVERKGNEIRFAARVTNEGRQVPALHIARQTLFADSQPAQPDCEWIE